jgi:hypothetical protein
LLASVILYIHGSVVVQWRNNNRLTPSGTIINCHQHYEGCLHEVFAIDPVETTVRA